MNNNKNNNNHDSNNNVHIENPCALTRLRLNGRARILCAYVPGERVRTCVRERARAYYVRACARDRVLRVCARVRAPRGARRIARRVTRGHAGEVIRVSIGRLPALPRGMRPTGRVEKSAARVRVDISVPSGSKPRP